MAYQQEAYFLHVLLQVKFRQRLSHFCLLDAAAYRTACINDLLRFQCEVVAEMRHIHRHGVPKVSVPQLAVAPIAGGKGHIHIRKSSGLGRFKGFPGGFCPSPVRLNTYALLVGKTEQFLYAHLSSLGTQPLAA